MDYKEQLQTMFWKGVITGYLGGIFVLLAIHRAFI